jgi:hypothetical protein
MIAAQGFFTFIFIVLLIVDGIDVQTWLTGKVIDVIAKSLLTKAVADIPISNRIHELNKRDMMAVYRCLEQNT